MIEKNFFALQIRRDKGKIIEYISQTNYIELEKEIQSSQDRLK